MLKSAEEEGPWWGGAARDDAQWGLKEGGSKNTFQLRYWLMVDLFSSLLLLSSFFISSICVITTTSLSSLPSTPIGREREGRKREGKQTKFYLSRPQNGFLSLS
jgi:hypothetical protein